MSLSVRQEIEPWVAHLLPRERFVAEAAACGSLGELDALIARWTEAHHDVQWPRPHGLPIDRDAFLVAGFSALPRLSAPDLGALLDSGRVRDGRVAEALLAGPALRDPVSAAHRAALAAWLLPPPVPTPPPGRYSEGVRSTMITWDRLRSEELHPHREDPGQPRLGVARTLRTRGLLPPDLLARLFPEPTSGRLDPAPDPAAEDESREDSSMDARAAIARAYYAASLGLEVAATDAELATLVPMLGREHPHLLWRLWSHPAGGDATVEAILRHPATLSTLFSSLALDPRVNATPERRARFRQAARAVLATPTASRSDAVEDAARALAIRARAFDRTADARARRGPEADDVVRDVLDLLTVDATNAALLLADRPGLWRLVAARHAPEAAARLVVHAGLSYWGTVRQIARPALGTAPEGMVPARPGAADAEADEAATPVRRAPALAYDHLSVERLRHLASEGLAALSTTGQAPAVQDAVARLSPRVTEGLPLSAQLGVASLLPAAALASLRPALARATGEGLRLEALQRPRQAGPRLGSPDDRVTLRAHLARLGPEGELLSASVCAVLPALRADGWSLADLLGLVDLLPTAVAAPVMAALRQGLDATLEAVEQPGPIEDLLSALGSSPTLLDATARASIVRFVRQTLERPAHTPGWPASALLRLLTFLPPETAAPWRSVIQPAVGLQLAQATSRDARIEIVRQLGLAGRGAEAAPDVEPSSELPITPPAASPGSPLQAARASRRRPA